MVISGKCFPIIFNGLPVYRDSKALSEIIGQSQSLTVTTIIPLLHISALHDLHFETGMSCNVRFLKLWVCDLGLACNGDSPQTQKVRNIRSIWYLVVTDFSEAYLQCIYIYIQQ